LGKSSARSFSSTETSYVREFENVSGKNDILTGAHYMPFITTHTWAINDAGREFQPQFAGTYTLAEQIGEHEREALELSRVAAMV